MSGSQQKVIIVGGGIGGLCLAQGLKKNGIAVEVYERDQSPDARLQGYRLNIEPRGSQALHACLPTELWDLLVATAGDPGPRMGVYDEQLRELMQEDEMGAVEDPAQSHHAVSRIVLRRLLLAGLEEAVHFNKQFIRYEVSGTGRVTAFFSDGTSAEGNLLVGADGIRSRVRRQLLPQMGEIQVQAVGIGGKLPLTTETRAWLPAHLQSTKNMILPPSDFLFTAAFRRRQSAADLLHQENQLPGTNLDVPELLAQADDYDYVMWAFVTHRKKMPMQAEPEGQRLRERVEERMTGWNPVLKRLVRETDPRTIQAFDFSAAARPKPWDTGNVTLIGDALHYMPPVGGMGGNAALHDAATLCEALLAIKQGKPLPATLRACEAEMLASGFEAVSASLFYTRIAISRIPLMRSLAKLFFRTCGVIAPLRRAVFGEPRGLHQSSAN